jgi:hypothetical protein
VVQLNDPGDLLEALLELLDLFKRQEADRPGTHIRAFLKWSPNFITFGCMSFTNGYVMPPRTWRCLEHPVLIDDKLAMLKRVDIALDQEEIRTALDRQETFARDVDSMGVLEMLDGCAGRSFQLGFV